MNKNFSSVFQLTTVSKNDLVRKTNLYMSPKLCKFLFT